MPTSRTVIVWLAAVVRRKVSEPSLRKHRRHRQTRLSFGTVHEPTIRSTKHSINARHNIDAKLSSQHNYELRVAAPLLTK